MVAAAASISSWRIWRCPRKVLPRNALVVAPRPGLGIRQRVLLPYNQRQSFPTGWRKFGANSRCCRSKSGPAFCKTASRARSYAGRREIEIRNFHLQNPALEMIVWSRSGPLSPRYPSCGPDIITTTVKSQNTTRTKIKLRRSDFIGVTFNYRSGTFAPFLRQWQAFFKTYYCIALQKAFAWTT